MQPHVGLTHTVRSQEVMQEGDDEVGSLADRTCLVDEVVHLTTHALGMNAEQLNLAGGLKKDGSGLKWVGRIVELLSKVKTVVEGGGRMVGSAELGDAVRLRCLLRLSAHQLVGRPLAGRPTQVCLLRQECHRLHLFRDVHRTKDVAVVPLADPAQVRHGSANDDVWEQLSPQ